MATSMRTRPNSLCCQACGTAFGCFSLFKKHVYGTEHKERLEQLFRTAPRRGAAYFPSFLIQQFLGSADKSSPVVGLQLVTAYVDTCTGADPAYLCHLCQEACSNSQIVPHLLAPEHGLAFLAYVSPRKLPFAWIAPAAQRDEIYLAAQQEEDLNGPGALQVLEVPTALLGAVRGMTYSQAVKELYRTDDLRRCLKDGGPKPVLLEMFREDQERSFPLLGLSFLVEYSSTGGDASSYLCLLCEKRIRHIQAVAHVISFDHIFWYLRCTHPSSLEKESSYPGHYTKSRSQVLDLARQAEQADPPGDVQVVQLDPEDYAKVDMASFSNALKMLQEIRKEQNLGDLQPQVTPGQPLGVMEPFVTKCRLICQNCSEGIQYNSIKVYKNHVRGLEHLQHVDSMLGSVCGSHQASGHRRTVLIPTLEIYGFLTDPQRAIPVIGLHQVTVCITGSAASAIYLCHICEFSGKESVAHLTSAKHYLASLAHTDPEDVPFGWMLSPELLSIVRSRAEAVERRQGEARLYMLHLPDELFADIKSSDYLGAMKKLGNVDKVKERLQGEDGVSLPMYLGRPKRNHPLVGLSFLVQYSIATTHTREDYLCLLCQSRVSWNQALAHVLGFDHVFSYLGRTRPSSLGSRADYQRCGDSCWALLVNLAFQAELIDSCGKIQEVHLDPAVYEEVSRATFGDAARKLQMVWETQKLGGGLQLHLSPAEKPGASDILSPSTASHLSVPMATIAERPPCAPLELKHATSKHPDERPLHSSSPRHSGFDGDKTTEMEVTPQGLSAEGSAPAAPKMHSPRPPAIQAQRRAPMGPIGESNWAKFWFLAGQPGPSIGLEAVVECRCLQRPTFYLCLTCAEQIPCAHICDHIVGSRHQYCYIKSLYPELLTAWRDNPSEIAWLVHRHERKWDVQVVKLHPASYQRVVSAPFYIAVQMIRDEQKQSEPQPLASAPGCRIGCSPHGGPDSSVAFLFIRFLITVVFKLWLWSCYTDATASARPCKRAAAPSDESCKVAEKTRCLDSDRHPRGHLAASRSQGDGFPAIATTARKGFGWWQEKGQGSMQPSQHSEAAVLTEWTELLGGEGNSISVHHTI